jgi:hypothetical protein
MGTPSSEQAGGAVPSQRQRDEGIPPAVEVSVCCLAFQVITWLFFEKEDL